MNLQNHDSLFLAMLQGMHNYYVLKITIPVSFDVNSKLKSDGWEGAVEVLHQ